MVDSREKTESGEVRCAPKLWGGEETGHASGWMRPSLLTTRWHCSSKAAWLIVGDREDKVGLPVPTNGVFTSQVLLTLKMPEHSNKAHHG